MWKVVKAIDLTGVRFGKLVATELAPEKTKHGHRKWICACDCGAISVASIGNLRSGNSTRCVNCRTNLLIYAGSASNLKHGQIKTRLYKIWNGIIQRTTNPNAHAYERYGGNGITICKEWRHDFVAFANHVGQPPSDLHTLDRRDNKRGYEPGNMRWATAKEQSFNRRTTRFVQVGDDILCITDAALVMGTSRQTLTRRVNRGEIKEVIRV